MKIAFHGATRTVTGSKHLLTIDANEQILLDCGMFQGMGKDTLMLNEGWGFEPAKLRCVIISHAHIDHVGLLPKLVKDGFAGDIYCTPATADLARILMLDSAYIQESDVVHVNRIKEKQGKEPVVPLYTEEDAKKVFPYLKPVPVNEPYRVTDHVVLTYTENGHILGAATINLEISQHGRKTHLTFSGDIGRYADLLLKQPAPFPQADFIIMESTYGNKMHEGKIHAAEKLLQNILETCIGKRGKLIIPAFSVGRTQELLYLLNQLELQGKLPAVRYFVDSPLSIETTEIVKKHHECYNKRVQDVLLTDHDVFDFKGLTYMNTAEESKSLNDIAEPCVIISASGMAEAGRVKHHIAHNIENHRTTIMLSGYCEPNSLGAKLKRGDPEVTIFGLHYKVKADIRSIENLSAHADYADLCQWLGCQDPTAVKKLFLVHGEYDVQQELRDRLLKKGFRDIEIPELHQEFGLG